MNQVKTHVIQGHIDGPRLLIFAGIHGDEYEPMAAVRELSQRIQPDLLKGSVTLVPVVNRPAWERRQRTGPDGLDLARTFPGNASGTITEQIAAEATQLINNAHYFIDLHTGGLAYDISPLAGYMLHENKPILETQRRMAAAMNLPIVWGTSGKLDGRSLSAARDANVPAIYAEWGGGGGCNPQGVEDYVTGCLSVMAELEMYDSHTTVRKTPTIVEDPRDNSGHLQLNYPAPQAGYFEPAVKLDDMVTEETILGHIYPDLIGPSVAIQSHQTGRVILLRALPHVEEGESVAVILETEFVET